MALANRTFNPIPQSWSGTKRILAWLAALLIAANVAFLVTTLIWPEGIQRATGGVIPRHFFRQFDAEPLDSYNVTHGIAHNSGDSLDKIASAVDAGAHGIEIDVISYRGELYARHNQPVTVFGEFRFRPVLLEDAWAAATTELVQLDLKETNTRFLVMVAAFLEKHEQDRRIVLISSWEPIVLAYFQEKTPWAARLLSIGTNSDYGELQDTIDQLQTLGLLDGVTILHDLLDRGTAAWLKAHDLLIFAWTVENLSRVNELTLLGVDAVVTDNLSILNLVREQREEEFGTPIASLATPVGEEPSGSETDTPGDDQGSA
jgi:glycerophosphoryl diester phosphodiesterase family protein